MHATFFPRLILKILIKLSNLISTHKKYFTKNFNGLTILVLGGEKIPPQSKQWPLFTESTAREHARRTAVAY